MLIGIKKISICIFFIVIFISLLFFYFSDPVDEVVEASVRNDLKSLKEATFQFKKDKGSFPQNLEQLKPYFNIMPSDPWGDTYIYAVGDGWVEIECCKTQKILVERFESK